MRARLDLLLSFLYAITLVGCDQANDNQTHAAPTAAPSPQAPLVLVAKEDSPGSEPVTWPDETGDTGIREIEWDALIPEDWRPEVLMDQYNGDDLSDDDPRAQELLDKQKALWKEAPIVPVLEGQRVKLPGFVVPLEMDAKRIELTHENDVSLKPAFFSLNPAIPGPFSRFKPTWPLQFHPDIRPLCHSLRRVFSVTDLWKRTFECLWYACKS